MIYSSPKGDSVKNQVNSKIIYDFMKINKIRKTQLCKVGKIGASALNKMLSGEGNFNVKALFRLARVMNVSVVDLLTDNDNFKRFFD